MGIVTYILKENWFRKMHLRCDIDEVALTKT